MTEMQSHYSASFSAMFHPLHNIASKEVPLKSIQSLYGKECTDEAMPGVTALHGSGKRHGIQRRTKVGRPMAHAL